MKQIKTIVLLLLLVLVFSAAASADSWLCMSCGHVGGDEQCASCGRDRGSSPVGSIVTFGSYEQDNDLSNGSEPIEWIVLDVCDGQALLLSRYGLDARYYHTNYTVITWANSDIRAWLNREFLNTAFTAEELNAIVSTTLDNTQSQCCEVWTSNGGIPTVDRVFLLSYAQAHEYLGAGYLDNTNMTARATPTPYAIARGAFFSEINRTADNEVGGWWWLRSPGLSQDTAAFIFLGGSVNCDIVRNPAVMVRPALWADLNAPELQGLLK